MLCTMVISLYWGCSPFKFPFLKRCGPECWRQPKNLKTLHSYVMIYIRFIHQVRLVYRFNATVRREVNRQSIIRAMQIPEKFSFCNSTMYFVGGRVELLNYHQRKKFTSLAEQYIGHSDNLVSQAARKTSA